jgi:hypothetical protein
VDFDGDGTPDLLSGSWPGQLYFFKGEGKGKFAAGKTIKDKNGKDINLGSASTVHACNWRGTGQLDLLVGDIDGHVWLVPNEGTKGKPEYGPAVKLQAAGQDIRVNHGDSHPIMADWEQTGKPGLIVGCGDGGVLWYRNIASEKAPKLDNPVTLVPGMTFGDITIKGGKDVPKPGNRAKVCVVDWNGDGKLDLLVGDFSSAMGEEPKLTDKQQEEKKEIQAKLAEVNKEMQPFFNALSKADQEAIKFKDPAERTKALQKNWDDLSKNCKKQLDRRNELYQALSKYQAPYFSHGYVWLYLRKTTAASVNPK